MSENVEQDKVLPIQEHIRELASRLKVWMYAFVVSTLFFLVFPGDPSSFFSNPLQIYRPIITTILRGVRQWLLPPQYILIGGTVTAPLEIIVVGAAVFGFLASIPVLAYEVYEFIDPAIRPNEKQSITPFVTAFTILFLCGALFAFFVLLPFVFTFSIPFFNAIGVSTFVYADDFYNLVFFVLLLTGLAFTAPVFFVLLVKLHVIETRILTKNRVYLWAGVFILTAIASPDGGPLADIALFIPMIIMIEVAIRIARRYETTPERIAEMKALGRICPYCNEIMDSGEIFCPKCGRSRL
jgi:sec-independent protein translocase protein TatC